MLRPIQLTTLTFFLVPLINAVTLRPVSRLTVANADISPDGFSRSYVFLQDLSTCPLIFISLVLS
jgi:hypothetical protein